MMKKIVALLLSSLLFALPACDRGVAPASQSGSSPNSAPEVNTGTQLPPKLVQVIPSGKEVFPTATITLQFNQEMNETTAEKIEVTKNGWTGGPTTGEPIPGKWSTEDGKRFSFTPNQPFAPGSLAVIRPTGTIQSMSGAEFIPDKQMYSFMVDDGHHYGYRQIMIPSMKVTNNGTHTIPMQIHIPEGDGPFRVMFYVHGGGWQGGTAEKSGVWDFQADYLVKHLGIAVIDLAYRNLGSKGTFTEAMEDLADGIQYARVHAADYHLDMKHFGLYAGSAGTPLAALTAQRMPDAEIYIGTSGIYDFVHVQAGNFGRGNSSFKQQEPSAEANSPIYNIRSNPPATLLMYGTKDTTINGEQSIQFAKAIQAAGGQAKVLQYKGEEHGFVGDGKTMEIPALFEIKEFIKEIWGLP